jgi:hypothetical protein
VRKAEAIYQDYYLSNNDERLELFTLIKDKYEIKNALYPGSYVHITPSFVIPKTTYVDNKKEVLDFFHYPDLHKYIRQRKRYQQEADVTFHHADYHQSLNETVESFDLLISLFADGVLRHCEKYLKRGGLLLAGDQYLDASLAAIDRGYKLVSVLNRKRNSDIVCIESNLKEYFILSTGGLLNLNYLAAKGRSIFYKKSADFYVFKKTK